MRHTLRAALLTVRVVVIVIALFALALAAALTLAAVFWVRWKLAERRARRAWMPGPNARWQQSPRSTPAAVSQPPPVVYIVPAADLRNEAGDMEDCECELWTGDIWQF